jgi:glutamine amidotransferase
MAGVGGAGVTLPATALLGLEARVDSALVWALALHRLRPGLAPAGALADTAEALHAAGVNGRFNFLLTDGHVIAATTAGDTLWHRRSAPAVVVASEPGDDEPGWTEVLDDSAVAATARCVRVTGLTSDGRIAIP